MSWWFPRFNGLGEIVSGHGILSLNGQDLGPGYSPVPVDNDHVISGEPPAIINIRTGERQPLSWIFSPRVGNVSGVSAGSGSWCGWSPHSGLVVNNIQVDIHAAPGSIDRLTGVLSYLTPYQSETEPTFRDVIVDNFVVRRGALANEIRSADGASVWSEWENGRWKLWGCIGHGAPSPIGPLPVDEPELNAVPVLVPSDGLWIVLLTAAGVVIYPWGDTQGYVLEGKFFYHDAIWHDGLIKIAATDDAGRPVLPTVSLNNPRTNLRTYHPSDEEEPPLPERPTVTITDYNPKSGVIPPTLNVKAVARLGGGPATKLIWSQSKNNGPWQVVAPNNSPDDPDHTYKFDQEGSYNLRVRVEGPGGSDETGASRIVTVTKKEEPPPPPQKAGRFWFGPNIGSQDLMRLFTESDTWKEVREKLDVFQLYLQHILDVGGGIGPNNFNALKDAGVFTKLIEWGIPLSVEMGSVKDLDQDSCTATSSIRMMKEADQKVKDAGGRISYIAMDEPLVSGPGCNQATAQTAEYTANFIREGKALGLKVGWLEAWPHVSVDTMAEFLQQLDKRGARPDFWHLDIDRKRAQKEGKSIQLMLSQCRLHAEDRKIPLGVIFVGYSYDLDVEYATDVRKWINEVHGYQSDLPHVKVQSWATRGENGPQDIPLNCPETDITKHVSILADAIERFS